MAVVLKLLWRTRDRMSATRTLHHVQAPMQSHAQAVVEVGVVDAMCVGRLVAIAAIMRRSKQQSFATISNQGHQVSGKRFPESASGQPSSVTSHPPAVTMELPI